jgi:hypothetical protein
MRIKFGSDSAYRKKLMAPGSMAHPAKANLSMMIWIIERYCKPGDWVVDPMCGVGSTLLMAGDLGINAIGIELEENFYEQSAKNIQHLKRTRLWGLGEMHVIHGDARALDLYLPLIHSHPSAIISSPPYGECGGAKDYHPERMGSQTGIMKEGGYGLTNGQLGNMKYGTIVFSPPYGGSEAVDIRKTQNDTALHHGGGNATNVPYSAGNLAYLQCAIFSPPYGNRLADPVVHDNDTGRMSYQQAVNRNDKTNIGSLELTADGTYLGEMLKVYRACLNVLSDDGLMILITKDFYRQGKRIELAKHTVSLCESLGFGFIEWHEREMSQLSFWQNLRARNGFPVVLTEDILVFKKGAKSLVEITDREDIPNRQTKSTDTSQLSLL